QKPESEEPSCASNGKLARNRMKNATRAGTLVDRIDFWDTRGIFRNGKSRKYKGFAHTYCPDTTLSALVWAIVHPIICHRVGSTRCVMVRIFIDFPAPAVDCRLWTVDF